MAVVGIKNFDKIERNLKRLGKVMGTQVLGEAMEAAGEVFRKEIAAQTPTGTGRHRIRKAYRNKRGRLVGAAQYRIQHAKNQVIVYEPIRKRSITELRRLVGWTRDAFYMFFVDMGWKFKRGRKIGARNILKRVFESRQKEAGAAALVSMSKGWEREAGKAQ